MSLLYFDDITMKVLGPFTNVNTMKYVVMWEKVYYIFVCINKIYSINDLGIIYVTNLPVF